jgi:DNA repair exonuclease SbcCD ATPase subunit
MSHIQFTKVGAKNFHSFESFDLNIIPGKHLIMGGNGFGKSSLLEAIVWTLYKKTQRGKDPSRDYKGDCWTMVEFVKDGNLYRAERFWKDKVHKNDLKLYMNGEECSLRRKTNTEEELQAILGIPHDLFVATVVVLQGLPMNFTRQTATIRKATVEEMIGFSVWEEYRTKFDGAYKELELERRTKEQIFLDTKLKMTALNAQIETLKKTKQSSKDEIQSQIEQVTTQLESGRVGYLVAQEELAKAKVAAEQAGSSLVIRSKLQHANSRITSLNKILHSGICSECGQYYPAHQVEEAKAEYDFNINTVQKLNKLLEASVAAENLYNQHNNYVNSLHQQQQFYKSQLSALEIRAQQQEVSTDLTPMQEELQGYLQDVNGYKIELEDINRKMEDLKYLYELMLPSSKFRTFVLEKYISYINQIIDSIIPMIFEGVEMKLVVSDSGKGIELQIVRNGKEIEYKSLSGGECKRLDIIVVLAFQRFQLESAGISTNLTSLDEIFDALDARGVENVMMCLESLYPESTALYVITHNDSLKSTFVSKIKVVKENHVSRIEAAVA